MPTWANWAGGEGQPDAINTIIGYKSVSTGTITRGSGTVAAKTVRLETLASQTQMQGQGGIIYQVDAFILAAFGTDLKVGDRFTVSSRVFEIIAVLPGHTDCVQCYLKLRG